MPSEIPDELKEVAKQVREGGEVAAPVRVLLSWFDAERRGYWKVREIRKALRRLKLKTEPDFEEAWIDAEVTFKPRPKRGEVARLAEALSVLEQEPQVGQADGAGKVVPRKSAEDVTSRIKIGMLSAANKPPLCIPPDAKISEAITLMMQHDYSQLPVTTTERDLKGMVSWKSLGSRLALGKQCAKVRDCMEPGHEIRSDASLFEAIQQVVEHECVLVRDATRKLVGIVTTADLGMQFAQLGEPFLLLGQIENHVRNLIADKFTQAELQAVRDPTDGNREIEDVSDLTLGEYIRLLEHQKRWDKLCVPIDRKTFIEELQRIGRIRNDVMHFDPDGPSTEDLSTLRKFARFLSDLEGKLV
ncbi:MAG: CBS domain-containing protein [Acidobacteriales bacterium]|nr:CBS domain-containing protein [Terriglobales bacterium]MCI0724815.1 CBS domain-containing protein [Acidobacteriota bacterium]